MIETEPRTRGGQLFLDAPVQQAVHHLQIEIEVRLFTAVMDGIGLQWLLNPETDIHASVTTYVERAIAAWRSRTTPSVTTE